MIEPDFAGNLLFSSANQLASKGKRATQLSGRKLFFQLFLATSSRRRD